MEYLVEFEVNFPPGMTEGQRQDLLIAERDRGEYLASEGMLRAIWRLPGQLANRAIWSAPDATRLHSAITSLPLWPYAKVHVIPLATHDLSSKCLGIPPKLEIPSF